MPHVEHSLVCRRLLRAASETFDALDSLDLRKRVAREAAQLTHLSKVQPRRQILKFVELMTHAPEETLKDRLLLKGNIGFEGGKRGRIARLATGGNIPTGRLNASQPLETLIRYLHLENSALTG